MAKLWMRHFVVCATVLVDNDLPFVDTLMHRWWAQLWQLCCWKRWRTKQKLSAEAYEENIQAETHLNPWWNTTCCCCIKQSPLLKAGQICRSCVLWVDYALVCVICVPCTIVPYLNLYQKVHPTTFATADTTIDRLQMIFTTHSLPDVVVSENGPASSVRSLESFSSRMEWSILPLHLTTWPQMAWLRGLSK